jgi:hypothetical protein
MYIFSERVLGYQCFEVQICIVCSKEENAGNDHLIVGILGLHMEGLHR